MGLKTLAEAIILQSAEDFMDENRKSEDVAFFGGEGFRICSWMAGMDHSAQCAFLNLLKRRVTVCRPVEKNTRTTVIHKAVLHA